MASIELADVKKTYAGGVEAVKGVSLAIESGELMVLVGPSGCGKSTLLRMIAGLETITSGTISIEGRTVNALEPAERDIAMVFQNYALYPHMSVRGNLEYGLRNRGTPRDEITRRVAEAAKNLEIEAFLDRKPRQLSGGQRQRVAMGRAIVRDPKAFLFDEPLSNLDAKLRVQMRGEIKQLQRRLGTTSVYVTHDQLEAMTLADRLVVLNGGLVEQIGAALEVYRRPASTFVAGFIGSPAMNLLAAHFDGSGLRVGEAMLPYAGAATGREVLLGVRAEDLRIADDAATPGLPMDVAYVEELGAQRLVHGRTAGQPIAIALGSDFPIGDKLRLAAPSAALHLFDKATGKRMPA
jgi:sn-glycerol 3-phosphate transport system ATP-binding protein